MNKRLLWLSDSPFLRTGYSCVSRNVLNGLTRKHGWDCAQLAWTYVGANISPPVKLADSNEVLDFNILSGSHQERCKDICDGVAKSWNADVFCILFDLFMCYPWLLEKNFPCKTAFYFPSDGEGTLPHGTDKILRKVDLPIAMSKFAQRQAIEKHNVRVEYVPHGIDPKYYHPLTPEQKKAARAKWGVPQDAFIIGNVFRNQPRKNQGALITTFKRVADKIPNSFLFLHADRFDQAANMDLQTVANMHGVGHRVIWSKGMNWYNSLPTEYVNEIYNCLDLKLDTTSGEGFGLTTIEGQATELPTIITDFTTSEELIGDDCGIRIPVASTCVGTWGVERSFIDEEKAAEAIMWVYEHRDEALEMGRRARKKVLDNYTWDIVCSQFDILFRRFTR